MKRDPRFLTYLGIPQIPLISFSPPILTNVLLKRYLSSVFHIIHRSMSKLKLEQSFDTPTLTGLILDLTSLKLLFGILQEP